MDQDKIIERFEWEFDKMKKRLGFRAKLADLDSIFFLRDYVFSMGFVSTSLSRVVCARMRDTYLGWYNYLHGIVMPNPSSMLVTTESSFFSDEEKHEMMKAMERIMTHISMNTLAGLKQDSEIESMFIDSSLKMWKNDIGPYLLKIIEKVAKEWKNRNNSD